MKEIHNQARDVLIVLSDQRLTGRELAQEMNTYYENDCNHWDLFVDTLVDEGYIKKERKHKRQYEFFITNAGRETLSEHMDWKHQKIE